MIESSDQTLAEIGPPLFPMRSGGAFSEKAARLIMTLLTPDGRFDRAAILRNSRPWRA